MLRTTDDNICLFTVHDCFATTADKVELCKARGFHFRIRRCALHNYMICSRASTVHIMRWFRMMRNFQWYPRVNIMRYQIKWTSMRTIYRYEAVSHRLEKKRFIWFIVQGTFCNIFLHGPIPLLYVSFHSDLCVRGRRPTVYATFSRFGFQLTTNVLRINGGPPNHARRTGKGVGGGLIKQQQVYLLRANAYVYSRGGFFFLMLSSSRTSWSLCMHTSSSQFW